MSLALVIRQTALVLGLMFTVIATGQASTPAPAATLSLSPARSITEAPVARLSAGPAPAWAVGVLIL